jgi:hypothetical protein
MTLHEPQEGNGATVEEEKEEKQLESFSSEVAVEENDTPAASTQKDHAATHKRRRRLASSSLSSSFKHNFPMIPFFAGIRQRQRWGDHQVHPHVNWGDIFFDLFYVAAAYNLGNALREDPTPRGVLYLCGCFWPLMLTWQLKLRYDSRYTTAVDDLWHRLYDVAELVPTATAVLYIRPVAILSRPELYIDMFALSASFTAGLVLSTGRHLEIMICQRLLPENQQPPSVVVAKKKELPHEGDDTTHYDTNNDGPGLYPEAFAAAKRDVIVNLVAIGFMAAATIYAGLQYYGNNSNDNKNDLTSTYASSSNTTTTSLNESHRFLASATGSDSYSTNGDSDIPIWLLLAGSLVNIAWFGFCLATMTFGTFDYKS